MNCKVKIFNSTNLIVTSSQFFSKDFVRVLVTTNNFLKIITHSNGCFCKLAMK